MYRTKICRRRKYNKTKKYKQENMYRITMHRRSGVFRVYTISNLFATISELRKFDTKFVRVIQVYRTKIWTTRKYAQDKKKAHGKKMYKRTKCQDETILLYKTTIYTVRIFLSRQYMYVKIEKYVNKGNMQRTTISIVLY